MEPDTILVCTTTTPAWTPLFSQAKGLVTDIGGALAHGSIVAREYGIPAVMGTGVPLSASKTASLFWLMAMPDWSCCRVKWMQTRLRAADGRKTASRARKFALAASGCGARGWSGGVVEKTLGSSFCF